MSSRVGQCWRRAGETLRICSDQTAGPERHLVDLAQPDHALAGGQPIVGPDVITPGLPSGQRVIARREVDEVTRTRSLHRSPLTGPHGRPSRRPARPARASLGVASSCRNHSYGGRSCPGVHRSIDARSLALCRHQNVPMICWNLGVRDIASSAYRSAAGPDPLYFRYAVRIPSTRMYPAKMSKPTRMFTSGRQQPPCASARSWKGGHVSCSGPTPWAPQRDRFAL